MSDLTPITREEALLDGADLEPITRKEQFIKRIYDKTQEVPTPITREEWFLNKAGEGGSEVTVEQLNATENGTYSEPGKAYSPVIVEVPEPTLITKSITANGTYSASADNADGYSQVTVAVEGFKKKSIANTPTDIASFDDGTANPMPSLEISIEPQQDLHGYDNPWPAGGGVNLFPPLGDGTLNGVTYTTADDGTITLNGTCSVSVNIYRTKRLTAGRYSICDFASGTFPNNADARTQASTTGFYLAVCNNSASDSVGQYTLSNDSNVEFRVRLEGGFTYQNCKLKPMVVSGEKTTMTYSPYSNICPISGHTEAGVTVTDDLTTPTETHTLSIPFHDSSDNPITVYGGTLNVTSGELRATYANIASYNGETINEPWISSMDVYSAGATPTTGAQVVYPLATPQTYQLTPAQVATLLNQNNIFVDCGQILDGEYFVTL